MASSATRAAWGLALLAHAALAAWLLAHGPSIATDDAAFFVAGVERFSILELRPHFPGYPGFIALGKALAALGLSPATAVFALSTLSALAIPALAAWAVAAHGGPPAGVLAAWAATLSYPLLPLAGLSMMSDATGIAFFLAALALLGRGRPGWGGAMAGMALACRPSFAIPVVLAIGVAWLAADRRARPWLAGGFLGVLLALFGVVLALEGPLYITEGLRFTEGHFLAWGNTAMAQDDARAGWTGAFAGVPLALGAFAVLALCAVLAPAAFLRAPVLVAATVGALAWTLVAQNPENLRHVLLPAVLAVVATARLPARWPAGSLGALALVQAGALVAVLGPPATTTTPAPLAAARDHLGAQPPGLVVTNRGVAHLRARLARHRIADAYYGASSAAFAAGHTAGPAWRLTATPGNDGPPIAVFRSRVPGEKDLYLYPIKRGT